MSHAKGKEFIEKLYAILEDLSNTPYISWGYGRRGVVIVDPELVGEKVLVNHFKHGNLNTLVRQLNKYGFHKVRLSQNLKNAHGSSALEFTHRYFEAGRSDMLHLIKRKKIVQPRKKNVRQQNTELAFSQIFMMQTETLHILEGMINGIYIAREDLRLIMQKVTSTLFSQSYRDTAPVIVLDHSVTTTSDALSTLAEGGFLADIVRDESSLLYHISVKAYKQVILSSCVNNLRALVHKITKVSPCMHMVVIVRHAGEEYSEELAYCANITVVPLRRLKDFLQATLKSPCADT